MRNAIEKLRTSSSFLLHIYMTYSLRPKKNVILEILGQIIKEMK
jgi:hypothetical protein